MKNKWIIIAFTGMVLLQWVVPAQMIFQKQYTIAKGKEFKFKIIPVDPVDPLRGRYLAISFDQNVFKMKQSKYYDQSTPLFVKIEEGKDQFAKVTKVYFEKAPTDSDNFIAISEYYTIQDDSTTTIHYTFPFSRYYVNEQEAPRLEKEYLDALRDSTKVVFAKVNVYKGHAVLKEIGY